MPCDSHCVATSLTREWGWPGHANCHDGDMTDPSLPPSAHSPIEQDALAQLRLNRLRSTMRTFDVPWLLTADPINISYATGVRNMNVFSMMGATRFMLVADSVVITWEFAGSEHLAQDASTIDEVRTAPGITALSGPRYSEHIESFADEVATICDTSARSQQCLGVERMDHPVTDALRSVGFNLCSATEVFVESRRIKLAEELDVMRLAMHRVEESVEALRQVLRPGVTEIDVWSRFHEHLIANGGEYVSTRLAQAGHRTFPYFQEAGPNMIEPGDLFCIDTDAIGFGGYAVDFSRSYHVGPSSPSREQRQLHALAREQLEHNAALLEPERSFGEFAASAWSVPARHAPFAYQSLAHGLGMSGEHPYVPAALDSETYPLDGTFEPGMVICVESYVGDPELREGIKLEDQYLITETGRELMSTSPFSNALNDP